MLQKLNRVLLNLFTYIRMKLILKTDYVSFNYCFGGGKSSTDIANLG